MAKLLFALVALSTLAYVSANFASSLNIESTEGGEPFATTLSQWLVDTVSRKIVALARFFNLKLRLVRFLVSLFTTDNLVLFRNLLEEAVHFGNFTLNLLPESVEDPLYWWVPAVSQFINISVGGEAGPVVASGEPAPAAEVAPAAEAAASDISEIVTNPPIFFNAATSSTETPAADSNDDLGVTETPVVAVEENKLVAVEEKAPIAAEEKYPLSVDVTAMTQEQLEGMSIDERERLTQEILKKYEENVISLDRLINGPRDN